MLGKVFAQTCVVPVGLIVQFRVVERVGAVAIYIRGIGDAVLVGIHLSSRLPCHDAAAVSLPLGVVAEGFHEVGPYADESIGTVVEHGLVLGHHVGGPQCLPCVLVSVAAYEVDVSQVGAFREGMAAYGHVRGRIALCI